jgi:chemotaxis protein methyltransferase CheR
VLIYFDAPTKGRVLEAIARQMPADALLYLGGAETVMGISSRFATHGTERGVYVLTPPVAPQAAPAAAAAPRFAVAAGR